MGKSIKIVRSIIVKITINYACEDDDGAWEKEKLDMMQGIETERRRSNNTMKVKKLQSEALKLSLESISMLKSIEKIKTMNDKSMVRVIYRRYFDDSHNLHLDNVFKEDKRRYYRE